MEQDSKSAEQVADDAKVVGQDALNKARAVANDAKTVAGDAYETGKTYARDAVNAAGKKIEGAKSRMTDTCDSVVKAINDEPVKAVVIAAVAGSILGALLVASMRSNDRYY